MIAGGVGAAAALPPPEWSRRVLDRSLAIAFAASLLIHGAFYTGWRWGRSLGWWEHQATWLLQWTKKARQLPAPAVPDRPREIPLTFVEVDPATASEPPKEAKYYGEFNSIAANPIPDAQADPKVEGNQTKIVRLMDATLPQALPLQPEIAKPEPEIAEAQPAAAKPPGTETAGRPDPNSVAVGLNEPRNTGRPRTLAEARRRHPRLAGEAMRQAGGVARRGRVALDVKRTPFGSYDAAFIAVVQQRWYDLIDSTRLAPRSGKVVLEFRLNQDGRISDMRMRETEVGEMLGLLCQRAVLDPAPYPRWPGDMSRIVGKKFRDVVFTFYYD